MCVCPSLLNIFLISISCFSPYITYLHSQNRSAADVIGTLLFCPFSQNSFSISVCNPEFHLQELHSASRSLSVADMYESDSFNDTQQSDSLAFSSTLLL